MTDAAPKAAYLALGANIGDPEAQLAAARHALSDHAQIQVTKTSILLQNPAWGNEDQPDFFNQVLEVQTDLSPIELLRACLAIETELGRVRAEKWGPRLIDIDVISYDQERMATPELTLPHPYAHERSFVIDPLREIAPKVADWVQAIAKATNSSG